MTAIHPVLSGYLAEEPAPIRAIITADLERRYRPGRRQRTAPLQRWLTGQARWISVQPTDAQIDDAAKNGVVLRREPYRVRKPKQGCGR